MELAIAAWELIVVSYFILYNAANLAYDPSAEACQSASDVAGDVTHADLIENHKQITELYQECPIANDGWEEFYSKVRKEINEDTK